MPLYTLSIITPCWLTRFIGIQVGRTVGCFPKLEASIALFGTLEVRSQEEVSKSHSAWASLLGFLSEIHDIFNNRNSPSVSGRQPRATAVDYPVVGGVSWTSPRTTQKGFSHAWYWGFYWKIYGSCREHCQSK